MQQRMICSYFQPLQFYLRELSGSVARTGGNWKLQIQERKNGSCKSRNIGSFKSAKSWSSKILKPQTPKLSKTQLRAKKTRSWKPRNRKKRNSKNTQLKFNIASIVTKETVIFFPHGVNSEKPLIELVIFFLIS